MYFQEKASNLFLKKEVMRVFIQDGNREKHNVGSSTEILSESFLNFSDICPKPATEHSKSTAHSDEDLLTKYVSDRAVKRIDCLFMMKVNDEIIRDRPATDVGTRAQVFEKNDGVFADSLNEQVSRMQSKLKQRKINSFLKGGFTRGYRQVETRRLGYHEKGGQDPPGGRSQHLDSAWEDAGETGQRRG